MSQVQLAFSKLIRVAAVLLLSSACSGSDGSAGAALEPCAPLDTQASAPIELGLLIGVGRAADDTLYVVDEEDAEFRVFISDGDSLQRYVVDGSGEAVEAGTDSILVTVRTLNLLLRIDTDEDGNVRMGLLEGAGDEREFEIGEAGEELEVLDESVLDAMTLRNLAGEIEAEYWAETDDGRLLLVTRPSHDWSYEDFRVFFGSSERIAERRVTNVARQRDGGTTTIEFVADGAATAYFPAPSRDEGATLSVGGEELELTLLSTAPATSDGDFYCR